MGVLVSFSADRPARQGLWRTALGATLRAERLRQERTLTEVAARAGVSMQYLSEVERGRKEASSEVLGAVGQALGLGLRELLVEVCSVVQVYQAPAVSSRAATTTTPGLTCLAA